MKVLLRSTRKEQRAARKIIIVPEHPVLADALTMLRKASTHNERFRQYADRVSDFLMIEATRDLPTVNRRIITPLAASSQPRLETDVVQFVVILRAGLALWPRRFLPKSRVGTIGIVREETDALAQHENEPRIRVYQEKLPPEIAQSRLVIVLDPMLATGGTAVAAIQRLLAKGVKEQHITFVCVIAAVAGVLKLHQSFPKVKIVGGALDKHLTKTWYIYPGLGDFGCRFFGTD